MRGRPLQFRDFSGGLNLRAGAYGLEENEAALVRNFRPTVRGSLKSRQGDTNVLDPDDLTVLGGQAMRSLSTVESLSSGTADDLLAGTDDGKLYRYQGGTTATLLGTFTANAAWDFIDAPTSGGQGPIYGVNGTIAKQITTAPVVADWTASAGTLPTAAKYLAYVGNRVWAAGMSSYGALVDSGSALVFSELGDPRDWPAANVVQFDPNDGEAITGIGEVGAGLLVLKPSKAWLVYDLDTGANRPLGVGVGGISHRSITATPHGTVWAGVKQVWISDGSTVRELGGNLVSGDASIPGIETYLTPNSTVDHTQPGPTIVGVYHDGRYVMSGQSILAGATTTLPLWEYDFATKSWWQHTTLGGLLAGAQTDGFTSRLWGGGHARLDRLFDSGAWLDASGGSLDRSWYGPYHTLGPGKERLRGVEVEGSGMVGVAAVPDFGGNLSSLTAREVRGEELLVNGTPRRESDFRTFSGVQPAIYATGVNPITAAAVPGYTATDVQVDALTLYVTRRSG
jgi:hypothetical protein